jgi:hypothetical protein
MIDTQYRLTHTEVEDILHNMSATELWQLNAHVAPINLNNTKVETEKAQKIYDMMDLTGLEYDQVERILDAPYNAPVCDIHIYCKAMGIDVVEFIKKVLA